MSFVSCHVRDMSRAVQFYRAVAGRAPWRIEDLPPELGVRTPAGLRPYIKAMLLVGLGVWNVDGWYSVGSVVESKP